MRTTASGKSILENIIEIIQNLEDSEIETFIKVRKQPAYIKLFQHLNRKIQAGAVAENFNTSELKKWIRLKNWAYDDLISNLYEKLIAFIGNEYHLKNTEVWMRTINQTLDAAEGLIDRHLLEQAKAILNKLDEDFKKRMPEYENKWDYALARFIFVRWRWHHLFSGEALPWMEEIANMIQSMSFSHTSHSRRKDRVENQIPRTREEWSGSIILLRLRWLHAQHYGDYQEQLAVLKSMMKQPALRNYQNATNAESTRNNSQANNGYYEHLADIEEFFLRLIIVEFAAAHGDHHTVQNYLPDSHEAPPARVLYPASSQWVIYHFYQNRIAYMFSSQNQAQSDQQEDFSLDAFLEFWSLKAEEEIDGLSLRMELHQILILCGSGKFEEALLRVQNLLKVRMHKANPDIRMLEILSAYQIGKDAYEFAYSLLTMSNKKSKDNPEWQFVKAFAKFMTNPPYLKHGHNNLSLDMERKAEEVEKLIALAIPDNPTHQLILWRMRRWKEGEGLEWWNKRNFGPSYV